MAVSLQVICKSQNTGETQWPTILLFIKGADRLKDKLVLYIFFS